MSFFTAYTKNRSAKSVAFKLAPNFNTHFRISMLVNNYPPYTCKEYREEMTLLALRRALNDDHLTQKERQTIKKEIKRLESRLNLD